MAFATDLRSYSDLEGSLLPLPVKLIIPDSLGAMVYTLGVGPLLILGVIRKLREPGSPRVLLTCACLALAGTLAFCQTGARFFLEPYLWLVGGAAIVAWRPRPKLFFQVMVCQLSVMALIAGFCAAAFFPGSLTAYLRNQTMIRRAYSYSEARWLDEVLPPEAVILTYLPFVALLPRPFLGISPSALRTIEERSQRQKALSGVEPPEVFTLVEHYPPDKEIMETLGLGLAEPLAGPQEFPLAKRQPLNRERINQIIIYPLKPDRLKGLKK